MPTPNTLNQVCAGPDVTLGDARWIQVKTKQKQALRFYLVGACPPILALPPRHHALWQICHQLGRGHSFWSSNCVRGIYFLSLLFFPNDSFYLISSGSICLVGRMWWGGWFISVRELWALFMWLFSSPWLPPPHSCTHTYTLTQPLLSSLSKFYSPLHPGWFGLLPEARPVIPKSWPPVNLFHTIIVT